MNQDRRGRLRDAAVAVLAEAGGCGLTHRAVDAAAEMPPTAKSYFPTRDTLLRAVAERCLEQYRALADALPAAGPGPSDRAGLAAQLAGPGRPRVPACLEVQAVGGRR
ncbi:TetR/AcrR family transcriptional regulator, partial [Streptomyces sp. NPDC029216]